MILQDEVIVVSGRRAGLEREDVDRVKVVVGGDFASLSSSLSSHRMEADKGVRQKMKATPESHKVERQDRHHDTLGLIDSSTSWVTTVEFVGLTRTLTEAGSSAWKVTRGLMCYDSLRGDTILKWNIIPSVSTKLAAAADPSRDLWESVASLVDRSCTREGGELGTMCQGERLST